MKRVKMLAVVICGVAAMGLVLGTYAMDAADEAAAPAGAKTYDFKDPKGVNGIGFFVNSKLEPFIGTGSGVSGEVTYDPANPEGFTGSISIDARTLRVTNPVMTEHMHSNDWLGVETNAAITVSFDEVVEVAEGQMGDTLITVRGTLKALGLSLPKTVTISVSHIPDGAAARGGANAGDLLVLRSNFIVTRKDLGIKPEVQPEKVGNEIGIVVGIAGYQK